MPGLSDLMQDYRALEIYRYFKKSFIYLKNPPKKPNKKTIPDLPEFPELDLVEDNDPIAATSARKGLSFLLCKNLINSGCHPPSTTSSFNKVVTNLSQDEIESLYTDPFTLSSLRMSLATLLHRQKDYKSFIEHPYNQALLKLFTELASNPHGITLQYFAAMQDDDFLASNLPFHIATIDVVTANHRQDFPLHNACRKNKLKTAKKLLQDGADPDAVDPDCLTPLKIACQNHNYKIIEILLVHEADIDDKTNGHTALHAACAAGDYDLAEFLLDNGASPYELDINGNNCRMLAEISGNIELARLVLAMEDIEEDTATISSSDSMDSISFDGFTIAGDISNILHPEAES